MPYKNNPMVREDIHKEDVEKHLDRIRGEFADGFELLKKYPRSVSIFGSARIKPDSDTYKKIEELSSRIAKELNYAVITGGGPGTMEAANKGAFESGGRSIGLNISLPHERTTNAYATHSMKFSYFFTRKTMLTFAAEAYVFFPGGFGTFDELFDILTLIQTEKIPRVPIILFGSHFWNGLVDFIKKNMISDYGTINKEDVNLFEITDSLDHVIEIIRRAPVSDWWRNIN